MKSWIVLMLMMFGWLLLPLSLAEQGMGTSRTIEAERTYGPAERTPTPVIVELFTSEGCSSCPPADEVLARLDKAQPVAGADILALAEHVDYWNRLGWADPYSSPEFSARQQQYARILGNDRVYTPQMVVDGQVEFVGSNISRARAAIAQATRLPKATVKVTRGPTPTGLKAGEIPLLVQVENIPAVRAGDTAEVLLAITENNLQSSVARGENAGRKLKHHAVVRKLSVIGAVNTQVTNALSANPGVVVARGWRRENLRAIVFVQERASRRVLGAAAVELTTTP